ncbi:calcium uniporter protein 4, mitochondrial-like [Bidens hawaiensis]|uniref:calcium uniporter protein 4, mitochondrial-like n=1 Tax=Bidens hawaiensis TaxID=980011 RepID=UPI00404B3FD1
MAFKQNKVQKLFNTSTYKLLNQTLVRTCSSSSSSVQSMMQPNPDGAPSEPVNDSIFRRFLQQRPLYLSSTANLPEIFRPGGEKLFEKIKEMDIARNLVRRQTKSQLTVADAKKILRASRIKMLKSKLRSNGKNRVSYDEFVQMCVDGCSDKQEGVELAKVLENSGSVIVLGNIVFLKPEQIVKAINELMIMTVDDAQVKELEEMEQWKSAIDDKAGKHVRRELWGGLGYLVVQTAAFMRLTFWELSWDVMEPICFYVTSLYFMLGFAYFIRTSREPCFEAFFQSRFHARQKKLMKIEGFDVGKYNELKKTCGSNDQLEEVSNGKLMNLQFDPSR